MSKKSSNIQKSHARAVFHVEQFPFWFTVYHTSQNSLYKWTKISSLEMDIFGLKMMKKSGLGFFYFEIQRAPSKIPANLPGQFSLSGPFFLHWAAATRKGLVQFQNKKTRPPFTIILESKMVISRVNILVHYFQPFQVV